MNSHSALRAWPVEARDALPVSLWSSAELEQATGGQAHGSFCVSGVEIDSRDVRNGDLFFALKGEAMDGHRFVDMAMKNGATGVVVDRAVPYPHILVDDTSHALKMLAAAARQRAEAVRIGVTGSVGKTGVKEAIFAALDRSSRGAAHRSVRSYNNHVGVPLSLARMPARSQFGIFEMGMNHAGEIARLSAQVRPHIAIITTLAPAHIENLGSMEAIADAKAEIFSGLEPGGTAIIPADHELSERLRARAREQGVNIVSFGAAEHADVRLIDAISLANGGSMVTADLGSERVCCSVAEPGEHWVSNALAVFAAVKAAGSDLGAAGLALAEMGGLSGRGARHQVKVPGGRALVIDESYNANPASMRATLRQLGETPAGRRIAILGSMKELGDFSSRFHAQLSTSIVEAQVDFAVLVGEEMQALVRHLGKEGENALAAGLTFAHGDTPDEAIEMLEDYGLTAGDAVLVKGSNSIGLGRVVSYLTDREN